MLLLKANPELKNVFQKLIKTMNQSVNWTELFVVMNNTLVLAGDVRSLIFNFDNKRVYTSIIEIPEESSRLECMPSNDLLDNVMNITLYSFGKWGVISGLKVDKNYDSLNALFRNVLRPVNVEPDFSVESFRFFKNGMQITYEEVMFAILKLLKQEGKLREGQSLTTSDAGQAEGSSSKGNGEKEDSLPDLEKELDDEYEIGLWHTLSWKKETFEFKKEAQQEADASKSRIGNNFYISNYLCPKCQAKLYMGVYPVDKELLIETEEGRVFMARTYACHTCNTFYTPRPQKLLQEGDVYIVKFDDDRTAYEDYLDVLGSKAERTTNHRFNEFEAERNKAQKSEPDADLDAETDIHADTAKGTVPAAESFRATGTSGGIKGLKEQFSKLSKSPFKNRKKHPEETEHYSGWSSLSITDDLNTTPKAAQTQSQSAAISDQIVQSITTQYDKAESSAVSHTDAARPKTPLTASAKDAYKQAFVLPESTSPKASLPKPGVLNPAPDSYTEAESEKEKQVRARHAIASLSEKTTDELKSILTNSERKSIASGDKTESPQAIPDKDADEAYLNAVRETLRNKISAKYDARTSTLAHLSPRQLSDLKKQIEKEDILSEEQKKVYTKRINSRLYQAEEAAIAQKIELSKNKPYAEIDRIIEDVKKRNVPEESKQEALAKLKQIKADRGKREVEHILSHMPLHLDRKQLSTYLDKIEQYKEVDIAPYQKQLKQRKDMAEKEEISLMIKRGGKKDRNALWNLYEQLQQQDYQEENKAPFLEKIYEKIQKMDEAKIEQICPSIASLSFADGIKAYNQISQGVFLPELKTNTLEMIRRRLTKLKTDESVQLMRKLKHDLEEKAIDCERFYFYDARAELRLEQNAQKNGESPESQNDGSDHRTAMLRAVNSYASARDTYEYPLMVCDISRTQNGKEGFVLTPDHIFYRTFLNSGIISIVDIEKVQVNKSLFGKGVYVKCTSRGKEKLPNHINSKNWGDFARVFDDFITYLQEKPESRSLEYLAKENHDVKCCYRCGFVYKSGNVCPKCGSKMNR